jgi:hypothetical protein
MKIDEYDVEVKSEQCVSANFEGHELMGTKAIGDVMTRLVRLSDEEAMRVLAVCVSAMSTSARIIDADDTVEQWLAKALKIDPDTAEWQMLQGAARSFWIASRVQGKTMSEEMTVKQWLAIRKEEALKIDPDTAEVDWSYGRIMDPYGIDPDLPEELQCTGRNYFARRPGSSVWVSFHDLPKEVCDAVWDRLPRGAASCPDEALR